MQEKKLFLDMIDFDLPDAVTQFASVAIPSIGEIAWPEDVEAATIAVGQLSANLNTVLQAFVGLAPVELILRNGGRNPLLKALVISAYDLYSQISQERLSELLKGLGPVKSMLEELIGTGSIPAADRSILYNAKNSIDGLVESSGVESDLKALLVTAKNSFDAALNAIAEDLDAGLQASANAIAAVLEWDGIGKYL